MQTAAPAALCSNPHSAPALPCPVGIFVELWPGSSTLCSPSLSLFLSLSVVVVMLVCCFSSCCCCCSCYNIIVVVVVVVKLLSAFDSYIIFNEAKSFPRQLRLPSPSSHHPHPIRLWLCVCACVCVLMNKNVACRNCSLLRLLLLLLSFLSACSVSDLSRPCLALCLTAPQNGHRKYEINKLLNWREMLGERREREVENEKESERVP